MLFYSWIVLIGILVGESYGMINPNYAIPPPGYNNQNDGFLPLWQQVVYQNIKIINNISYLHVDNLATNIQVSFKVVIDKTVPVIHNNLAKTVHIVISDLIQQRIFVYRAYLNAEKNKFVIENYFSRTGYSLVSGNGNGTVLLSDYDKNLGLVKYTRKIPQILTSDSYGNQFIQSTDHMDSFYFPIYNDSKSNLPIVFDELTGEGLLVQRKTNDTDLKYYCLEYDMNGNWRAIFSNGLRHFVQKDKLGNLLFSSKIKAKDSFLKESYSINSIPGTSDTAVKRNFQQYLEIDKQGKATLASVDPILNSIFRYPVENLNNLPVVYDLFNQSAYLVTPTELSKLYTDGQTYVIKDKKSNTGYNSVKADASGKKLSFKAYNQKIQDLKPVTKEFMYMIIRDQAGRQLFTATYMGPFFNETGNPFHFFFVSRDIVYNIPVVYDHLSGQAYLIAYTQSFNYGLEEPSPGKFVAVDPFTNKRENFNILENGDVNFDL